MMEKKMLKDAEILTGSKAGTRTTKGQTSEPTPFGLCQSPSNLAGLSVLSSGDWWICGWTDCFFLSQMEFRQMYKVRGSQT